MTNEKLLRERVESSGLKRAFIAEKLGMSYQTLLNKERNETEFTASEISQLCDLLKIDFTDREAIFFASKCDETSSEQIGE